MSRNWIVASLFAGIALSACTDMSTSDVAANDAANDVNTTPDTAVDVTVTDSGVDAGTDVTMTDAGTDAPADVPVDAPPPALNGCTTFTDLSAAGADRTITFTGTSYTPNCIQIAVGQSVTWSGMFSFHPLTPGAAPSRPTDPPSSTPNPITATATGTTATFPFATAGDYGFYCAVHEAFGMYGVVRVR